MTFRPVQWAILSDAVDCTFEGTRAHEIVKAAKSFGFTETRKHTLDLSELKTVLAEGFYPIVYLKTRLGITESLQEHAVVVVEIKQSRVFLLDPKRGEIEMLEVDFDQEWNAMRRVGILVK